MSNIPENNHHCWVVKCKCGVINRGCAWVDRCYSCNEPIQIIREVIPINPIYVKLPEFIKPIKETINAV